MIELNVYKEKEFILDNNFQYTLQMAIDYTREMSPLAFFITKVNPGNGTFVIVSTYPGKFVCIVKVFEPISDAIKKFTDALIDLYYPPVPDIPNMFGKLYDLMFRTRKSKSKIKNINIVKAFFNSYDLSDKSKPASSGYGFMIEEELYDGNSSRYYIGDVPYYTEQFFKDIGLENEYNYYSAKCYYYRNKYIAENPSYFWPSLIKEIKKEYDEKYSKLSDSQKLKLELDIQEN